MDLQALRNRQIKYSFDILGVPATLTRPWETPIPATVVWLRPHVDDAAPSREYSIRGARWVMAIRRVEVPGLERVTIIRTTGPQGEGEREYQVDGMEAPDRDCHYAIVTPRNSA